MEISDAVADKVYSEVLLSKQNIVLSDIPQSAKSTVEVFRAAVGFETVDTDYEIEKRCGMTKNELIDTKGEEYFRNLETEVIREVSSQNTCVISVGKGGLLKEENVHLLKRNGKIFVCESEHNLDKKEDVVVPYTDETEIIDYIISKRMELV